MGISLDFAITQLNQHRSVWEVQPLSFLLRRDPTHLCYFDTLNYKGIYIKCVLYTSKKSLLMIMRLYGKELIPGLISIGNKS